MAREPIKPQPRKKAVVHTLPLTGINYRILAAGLLVITLGYIALLQEPWDGTLPLVVSPILLLLGYCVLVPLGILYRQKSEAPKNGTGPGESVHPA